MKTRSHQVGWQSELWFSSSRQSFRTHCRCSRQHPCNPGGGAACNMDQTVIDCPRNEANCARQKEIGVCGPCSSPKWVISGMTGLEDSQTASGKQCRHAEAGRRASMAARGDWRLVRQAVSFSAWELLRLATVNNAPPSSALAGKRGLRTVPASLAEGLCGSQEVICRPKME